MAEIKTLHHLVHSQCDDGATFPAVVFDDGENKVTITYSQMIQMSQKVSICLSSHNVQDEVIGVCISPNVHTPTLFLGILESGACFYNFESTSTGYVQHVIDEVGIRFLLMDRTSVQNFNDLISEYSGEIITEPVLEEINASLIILRKKKIRKQLGSLAYCITTSGTTGTPKIVCVPHSCILPNIIDLSKRFNITKNDVVFLSSPLTFDPSIVDIFVALSSGACLLIVPHVIKMMPKLLLDMLCIRHSVTVIQATPTLISRLDNSLLPKTLLSETTKLKILALGGEKFPPLSVLQQWRAVNNKTRIFNLYGTTEVSCWATCYELSSEDFSHIDQEIPLGSPLTFTTIVAMDTTGKTVHKGQGELFIESPQRKCYLHNEKPSDVDAVVSRGTGDIVEVKDNGDIVYLGRLDDQVKRNGRRINLCEIKLVMLRLSYITNCEVLYKDGKLAVFVNISEQDTSNQDLSCHMTVTIETHLRNSLPSHYWPDYLQCVKAFPVTRHGKLDKDALWKIVFSRQSDVSGNQKDAIDILKKEWKEILSVHGKSINSSARFLMCGGDSFRAVRLADQLELTLGIRLPKLLDLILHKTFSDICSYVEKEVSQTKFDTFSDVTIFKNKTDIEISENNDNICLMPGKLKSGHMTGKNLGSQNKHINPFTPTDQFRDADIKGNGMYHYICGDERVKNNSLKKSDNYPYLMSDVEEKDLLTSDLKRKRKISLSDSIHVSSVNNDMGNEMDQTESKYENNLSTELCISRGNRIMNFCNRDYDEIEEYKWMTDNRICESDKYIEMGRLYGHAYDDAQDKCLCIEVKEVWKYNTGKCVDASPLVVRFSNGLHTVYIGSHSHRFSAVTMETGHVQWETVLADRIESSACLSKSGTHIIVGCYDGAVYCINAFNGCIWWEFQTAGEVKSSPVLDIYTGLVIFGSHDQHVYALNVEEKKCIWKTKLSDGSVFSSPCIGDSPHHVYACNLSGGLAALNPHTGSILWYYKCSKPIFSSPVVTSDGICVGCVSGQLLLIDFEGKQKWSFQTDGPIFSSPVTLEMKSKLVKETPGCSREMVLIGSHDGHVYGLTLNGDILWKLKCESAVYSTVFCVGLDVNKRKTELHKPDSYSDETKPCLEFSHTGTLIKQKRFDKSGNGNEKQVIACSPENDSVEVENKVECTISKFRNMKEQRLFVDEGRQLCQDYCNICVAASTNGMLYLIDIENGHILHRYKLPGEVFSSPVVVNNHIIIGCRDDFVYCLEINCYMKNKSHNS